MDLLCFQKRSKHTYWSFEVIVIENSIIKKKYQVKFFSWSLKTNPEKDIDTLAEKIISELNKKDLSFTPEEHNIRIFLGNNYNGIQYIVDKA
jgi:hypothetical protein